MTIELAEKICLAIEKLGNMYSEQQLIDIIDEIVEDMQFTLDLIATLNANGFPELTPAQLRAIVRSFPANNVA